MKLFNPALLKPQAVIFIAAVTVATHILLKPAYKAIGGLDGDNS